MTYDNSQGSKSFDRVLIVSLKYSIKVVTILTPHHKIS